MLRKSILVMMIFVGLAAIGSLFVRQSPFSHQEIKSCFNNAQELKPGAAVSIAGVDVGAIRYVRADPQNKNCPAEVEMAIVTSYNLRVPKDSIAAIKTAGVLGPSYVDIEVGQASGPPIENYGYLKSEPTEPFPSVENLIRFMNATAEMIKASKASENTSKGTGLPPLPSKR
jgi:phospholipid/cholesterol/gamma-HCH transport system substrate-binding protein